VILGCSLLLLLPWSTEEKRRELTERNCIDDAGKIVLKEHRAAMLKDWGIEAIIASSSMTT
jgi:hypothetical protein